MGIFLVCHLEEHKWIHSLYFETLLPEAKFLKFKVGHKTEVVAN